MKANVRRIVFPPSRTPTDCNGVAAALRESPARPPEGGWEDEDAKVLTGPIYQKAGASAVGP